MSGSLVRRIGTLVAGIALVGSIVGIVGGAPPVTSGPISLPTIGGTKDIWNGPATNRVGARVAVSSGTAKVQSVASSGAVTPLGQVTAGNAMVWEGAYDKLQVVAMTANTMGSYECRAPVGGADMDRLVGLGTVTLPQGGGTMGVFKSDAPVSRLVLVQAGNAPVTLKLDRNGVDVMSIDAGDTGVLSMSNVTDVCVSGNGTASFKVYDVAPSCGPYAGYTTVVAGDVDAMKFDGTKALTFTLTNTGSSPMSVTSQLQGDAQPTTSALSPGESKVIAGAIMRLEWTATGGSTTTSFTVAGQ